MSTIQPVKKLSFLERVKHRLLGRKKLEDSSPNRVSGLVAASAKKIEESRDLRALQRKLLLEQQQLRKDAPIRREVNRANVLAYRARTKRPQASAKIDEVVASHDGDIYLHLDNGQLLRAEKGHKNPVVRGLIRSRLLSDLNAAGAEVKETVS